MSGERSSKLRLEAGWLLICRALFCLLLFASYAPGLKASPAGSWAGGSVNLVNDPLDGLRHLRRGHAEFVNSGRHIHDATPLCNLLIHRFCIFDVQLPLLNGELAGDVVDDLSLLGSPVGAVPQDAEKSDSNSANTGAGDSDHSSQDSGVDALEIHEMWLVATVGLLIGAVTVSLLGRGR